MRLTTSLALLLAALAIAACGADDPETDAPAGAAAPAEQGAFPVTIDHKHGSTTIEQAPERVAVVGLREQDPLLALGIVPVATTEWFGDHPGAIFPWAKDELGDAAVPTVLTSEDGIEIEKVAAQRPDLIVGVYSGITKKEYDVAVEDRARRRPAQGQAGLRHVLAGGDHDRRQGGGEARGGRAAGRRHRAADRRREGRPPGVRGQERRDGHGLPGRVRLRPGGHPHPPARGARLRLPAGARGRVPERVRRPALRRAGRRDRHRRRSSGSPTATARPHS